MYNQGYGYAPQAPPYYGQPYKTGARPKKKKKKAKAKTVTDQTKVNAAQVSAVSTTKNGTIVVPNLMYSITFTNGFFLSKKAGLKVLLSDLAIYPGLLIKCTVEDFCNAVKPIRRNFRADTMQYLLYLSPIKDAKDASGQAAKKEHNFKGVKYYAYQYDVEGSFMYVPSEEKHKPVEITLEFYLFTLTPTNRDRPCIVGSEQLADKANINSLKNFYSKKRMTIVGPDIPDVKKNKPITNNPAKMIQEGVGAANRKGKKKKKASI